MLDDMPRQSTALTATSGADVAAYDDEPLPAKTGRRGRKLKQKIVKPSAFGMFLKPIGIAIGLVLIAYALLSLGTTFYRSFALAFQDRKETIDSYADWFFAWKRSYVVLKETISSAVSRFFETGKYESLGEAIEADVNEYFLRNYTEQVLKPELRDDTITKGVEQSVRHAHDSYRRVIANGDMRLQLFLAKHTSHMEDIPATTSMTNIKLDWDAQKWKAPVYLMEDRAFDGVVGVGTAAAGGTVGALALGRAINGIASRSFGQMSARVATSLATRATPALQGAAVGTAVQPMGGQVIGAAIGVVIGIAIDYLANEANEAINRESFVAANEEALDATIAAWKSGLEASVDTAIDKWFDDARASVVLASQ